MVPCPHSEFCPLYPRLRGGSQYWRDEYCEDDIRYTACARFKLLQDEQLVPATLMPNGTDLEDIWWANK